MFALGAAPSIGEQTRAASYPKPTWVVRAWVIAPGYFASESLETVRVRAADARGAISRAVRLFESRLEDPFVVYVARVRPPWRNE